MKRFINLVFVFLGTVVITASCGPKDKNVPIVNKAFKAYVQKTFDDPNSLKEIVEIVPHDTISMESIKALVKLETVFAEHKTVVLAYHLSFIVRGYRSDVLLELCNFLVSAICLKANNL